MFLLNTTDPLTVVLFLVATILLIFLGREIKKPVAPAIALAIFLILLLIHAVQLNMATYGDYGVVIRSSIILELVMVFVTFFSYLWVDDIASKAFDKKSYDNSLDWFWKQV